MELNDIEISLKDGVITLPVGELCEFIRYVSSESRKEADLRHKHIYEFFDSLMPDNEFYAITPNKVPSYMKSLWEVLKRDFDILQMKDYGGKGQFEVPVSHHEFEIDYGIKESFPLNATIFAKEKNNGNKIVLSLIPFSDGVGHHLEIESFFDSDKTTFRDFWNRVEEHFISDGCMKEKKFDTNWRFIKYDKRDWNSIVMTKETKKMLERNIINFITNIEEYKDKRLPTSRGILITGPPGTGKTLCCETIMNLVGCTTIYVTSDSVERAGDIKEVYKLARKLSPTIVIIEDIDTLGGLDRRERGNHPLLGEFLNCLNGVGNNEGVITIATTNYPENLDVAIADRPGRFDLRIEFGLPDKELREHILRKYLNEVNCKKLDLKRMALKTEGLSGAYLREIVMTAYMIAGEEEIIINNAIMDESIASVMCMKEEVMKSYGHKKLEETIYG